MGEKLDNLRNKIDTENNELYKLIEKNQELKNKIKNNVDNDTTIDSLRKKVEEKNKKLEEVIDAINENRTDDQKINIDQISEGLKSLKNTIEGHKKSLEESKNSLKENLKEVDKYKEKLQEIEKEREKLETKGSKLSKTQKKNLEKLNNLYDETNEKITSLTSEQKIYKDEIKDISGKLKDITDSYNLLNESSKEYYTENIKLQEELNKRQQEGYNKLDEINGKIEKNTKGYSRGFKEISSGFQEIVSGAKKMSEPWRRADEAAMSYAKTMGIGQANAEKYLKTTLKWADDSNIGILYNKSTDELIAMQGKYSEVLGRNIQLTGEQKKDMLAMEAILGEETMLSVANNLENFGLGMGDSAEFVKKTMDEATKSGIAASKLTKTINENIKMAQNYTFKNGLDGLTNMAKKAIQLKTDMSLINGFIEKTSTVEGAISTGAQLQVLGGSYAMGSDPLSMMYESLSDAEGLFDRAVNMAKGKVYYDEESGNFEMGAMDRYMMKQAATVMGIDPSKLIDVAYRQASLGRIEEQIQGSKIANDSEMVEMVKNVATWENGEAVVDINGKKKKVSELDETDKEHLSTMQMSDSQTLQDMAVSLRSMNAIMSGTVKEGENSQANIMHDMMQSSKEFFEENTSLLNTIADAMAWFNIIGGGIAIVKGLWTTVRGIARIGSTMIRQLTSIRTAIRTSSMSGGGVGGVGRGRVGGRGGGMLSKFTKGWGGAAVGGLAAGGLSLISDVASGRYEEDPTGSWIDAGTAGIGAAIGGFFGPVGMIVGGLIGSAVGGLINNYREESKKTMQQDFLIGVKKTNPFLSKIFEGDNAIKIDDYDEDELTQIKVALVDGSLSPDELSVDLIRKLRKNDDLEKIKSNGINVKFAKGGVLQGNTHNEGGIPLTSSNGKIEVAEGGEFIVNKQSTSKHINLLNAINNDTKISPIEPLGKQMTVINNYYNNSVQGEGGNNKIKIEPITLNLNGNIKLDSGNGKQTDISDEILKNPTFIKKITEMISREINLLNNKAFNKENYVQKFA